MMAVVGCYVSYFHPTRHPSIHWLGILLPLILLLNALILFFWISRRSVWMLVPIVALLISLPYISSVFHWPLRKQAPPKRAVTVVTYNIHSEMGETIFLDTQQFAEFLESEKVDIICLQEFPVSGVGREGLILDLSRSLPYHRILSNCPGALSVAVFSRYPILNAESVVFTDETDNISMWADLDLKGERIRLFNNHLQTTNINQYKVTFTPKIGQLLSQLKKLKMVVEENGSIRTRQADAIRKLLDESPYPLIVCGDFNAPPASYTYRTIKGDLRDSFRDVGKGYGYSYRYLKKLYRIDYIFYSPGSFRATRYYSPELKYSDHKPVVVTFDFASDDSDD
ncbi:MAG: Endonuclease/exonuclease/phosphatase family protein [Proteiniphilum sp.]|nr:Endonuclease/exonuclease/phosphatase family protein [Proteiniphilum sp.]